MKRPATEQTAVMRWAACPGCGFFSILHASGRCARCSGPAKPSVKRAATVTKIKGETFPLFKAFVASGAVRCSGCRSFVFVADHRCDGIPLVSRLMLGETARPSGLRHHDPVAAEWTELEAEEANAEPEEVTP